VSQIGNSQSFFSTTKGVITYCIRFGNGNESRPDNIWGNAGT